MKKRYMFCMVFVVMILTIHFAAGGLIGSQKQEVFQYGLMDNTNSHPIHMAYSLISNEPIKQDKSIFSKTTVFFLFSAVIGIIAFRRNIYM